MRTVTLKALVSAAVLAAFAGPALAGVTFSNVNVGGSGIETPYSVNVGASDIDFSFNNALVGDLTMSASGYICISYEATADQNMTSMGIGLSLLGALSGSGTISFEESVYDCDTNALIGYHQVTLDSNDDLPYTHTFDFNYSVDCFKAVKKIYLDAPDTQAFDLAGLALIEQRITTVPEPASMAALGMGLAAIAARRRKKA